MPSLMNPLFLVRTQYPDIMDSIRKFKFNPLNQKFYIRNTPDYCLVDNKLLTNGENTPYPELKVYVRENNQGHAHIMQLRVQDTKRSEIFALIYVIRSQEDLEANFIAFATPPTIHCVYGENFELFIKDYHPTLSASGKHNKI